MLSLILLAGTLFAQPAEPEFGVFPAEVPSFHLMVEGRDLGEVLLATGSGWWTKSKEDLPAGYAGVSYQPDTPWDPQPAVKLPRDAELSEESSTARSRRLKEGWKAAGYVLVKSKASSIYVKEAVQEAAAKAMADEAAIEKLSSPGNLKIAQSAPQTAQGAGVARPAWRGYVAHVIVIVVALIAGAVIVKVLILGGGDDDWERVG